MNKTGAKLAGLLFVVIMSAVASSQFQSPWAKGVAVWALIVSSVALSLVAGAAAAEVGL